MSFTKVVGPGIHTLAQLRTHNIHSSGIITATKFDGPFDGSTGDFSGNVTVGGNLTVNGTTTTLDTNLIDVDKIEVTTAGTNVAVAVTHNGSGDLVRLYDGASQVVTVDDEGNVGSNSTAPTAKLEVVDSGYHQSYMKGSSTVGGIRFGNNTHTDGYIYYDNGPNMIFNIGADGEKLRITSDGVLKLTGQTTVRETAGLTHHTNGNLYIRGGTTGAIIQSVDENEALVVTNTYITAVTAGAERLRITSDGVLSFKNSSPPAWSTDQGYANATFGSSGYLRTDTDSNNNFLTIGSNAYRSASGWKHTNTGYATRIQTGAQNGDISYSVSTSSGSADGNITWSEKVTIDSSGQLGIGIASPSSPLHAYHATTNTIAQFQSGDAGAGILLKDNTHYTRLESTNGTFKIDVDAGSQIGSEIISFQISNSEKVRITSEGALGIGNLATAQSTSTTHTSSTKFYIDSTKLTKIARLAAGNISSAGWFTVAKIASSNGNHFKCYASLGGDFTQDMCVMELTGSFSASGALSNAYAEPVFTAHRVGAHSTDRITRARFVKDGSNVTYLQIYIASGHSSYWGKSVLEYTMGAYAQNIADSGSSAMFEAQASGLTGIRTLEVDDNAICVNAGSHKFYSGGNATERVTIDSSGRLLVGSAAVTYNQSPLYVSGTDPVVATFHHSDGGTNDEARIALGALVNNPPYNRGVYLTAKNNGSGHDFIVAASASHAAGPSEKLRITSDGKMGLNHTTPPSQFVVRAPGGSGHCSSQVHSGDSSTIMNMQTVQGSEGRFGMNTNHDLAIYANGLEKARLSKTGSLFIKSLDTVPVNQAEAGHYASTGYSAGHALGLMVKRAIHVSDSAYKGQGGMFLSHSRNVTCDGTTYNMFTIHNREGCLIGDIYVGFSASGSAAVRHYKFHCYYAASTLTDVNNPGGRATGDSISANISSSNDAHFFQVTPNQTANSTQTVTMTIVGQSSGTAAGHYYTVTYN